MVFRLGRKNRPCLFRWSIEVLTLLAMTNETACEAHVLQLEAVVNSTVACVIVHMLVCALIRIMDFTVLVWDPHDEWSMSASLAPKQRSEPVY